ALYHESLDLFRDQGSPLGTAEVLLDLGRAAHHQGDSARALALYQESLALLDELGGTHMIAICLERLAGLLGARGEPERAARLFGAAESLRESLVSPLRPVHRADYERDLAAARARLDPAAWAAAWEAGRVVSSEQAIAEARRAAPEPEATRHPASGSTGALTPRERQVIALIARGYSNRAIAEALVITERTAEIHVGNILGKLGFTSRAQAAAYAVAQGLADPSVG
ncbi:MAG TPA: LuxR family transcriptional regulator, partial [Roseiflexaceae bacterium]